MVKLIVPPRTNDLDVQQRWRWAVFASIIAISVAFTSHLALECGWLPELHPGFASQADVKNIEKKIDLISVISIERDIKDKIRQMCKSHDPELRLELNDDIDRLQRDYKSITGDWYRLPKCEDL